MGYTLASSPKGPINLEQLHNMTTRLHSKAFSKHLLANEQPIVTYAVNVTNLGDFDSDDVVLGFLKPPNAGIDGIPLQSLYGFEWVHVKVGETKTVVLYPDLEQFLQVDRDGHRFVHPG